MKVIVIGSGATGLALSHLLALGGAEVTVLEGAQQPGGLLATFDLGDGTRLEECYHHFFTHDAELNWLLRELHLDDHILYRKSTMGIFRGGRLYAFDGARDLLKFRAIGLPARLRFGASSALLAYLKKYTDAEHVSCLDWFRRWAGHEATEAIWRPMLKIKFGEAAEEITLAWMAGRLQQRALSRKHGEERLGYLEGSMQLLIDRWMERLHAMGVKFRFGNAVSSLLADGNRVIGAQTEAGQFLSDCVVSTLPTPEMVPLLRPISASYADGLSRIRYMGAICTVLSLREPLSEVYWTNVADPDYDFGGVIEHTNLVPAENYGGQHLAYLSRYLDHDHPLWKTAAPELLERLLDQLSHLYRKDIRSILRKSWVFHAKYATPVPHANFQRLIPAFRSPIPGLYLAGMCHLYPEERSVNNSIRIAAEAARAMGFDAQSQLVPRGRSVAGKYGAEHLSAHSNSPRRKAA
jgi:protoporphyrinogen oxidase